MYLPKSKYTVSIAKPGQYLLNGETYIGPVITTYTGDLYAGDNIRKTKGTLTRVKEPEPEVQQIVPIKRVPTEAEYKAGYMFRYFCQDKRSAKVFEISKVDFDRGKSSSDFTYYGFAQTVWNLSGAGAINANTVAIRAMEHSMPGIISSKVLCDPEQFYEGSVE